MIAEVETNSAKVTEKYSKNPSYVSNLISRILKKHPNVFSHIQINQFAIVQRNATKPARYGAVKKIRLIKDVERPFFKSNPECPDAQFLFEVDRINFSALDEEDQEKLIFKQLCKIFYDDEKEKYMLLGPDAEIYLAMVRVYGKNLEEVLDVNRALSLSNNDSDEDLDPDQDD